MGINNGAVTSQSGKHKVREWDSLDYRVYTGQSERGLVWR